MNREVEVVTLSKRMECIDGIETGRQIDEPIEITNSATYFSKSGLHYIFYDEKQDDSPVITKAKIIIHDSGKMELIKKGAVHSHMIFQIGERHESRYATPYLQMDMVIETLDLSIDMSEEVIEIKNKYRMELNGEIYAICHMEIKIK